MGIIVHFNGITTWQIEKKLEAKAADNRRTRSAIIRFAAYKCQLEGEPLTVCIYLPVPAGKMHRSYQGYITGRSIVQPWLLPLLCFRTGSSILRTEGL